MHERGNAGPVAPGSIHEAWIRKVVLETGGFDNVIYEDGNEIGLVPSYAAAWTTSMQAIVRDEETKNGYGHHLFGTNSGDATAMQSAVVQYLEFHQQTALACVVVLRKAVRRERVQPEPGDDGDGAEGRVLRGARRRDVLLVLAPRPNAARDGHDAHVDRRRLPVSAATRLGGPGD